MEKNCEDCVHALRTVDELPCCDCHGYKFFDDARIPSKTLLDEFAMAAPDRVFDEGHHGMASFASSAYQYAAAMMKERARRDEMGNVKEVK